MAISKGGKVVVAILAGVATLVAGFVVAYKVSDDFKAAVDSTWHNFTNKFKSDEKKDAERKEKAQKDDKYKELDDDNKKEFDDKFDKITESDEYKDMTDKEKDDLVDKLIESEKIQQDIQKEQEEQETRKEEIKQELGGMSEELNNILTSEEELTQSEQVAQVADAIANTKNELQEIINSETATAEEIAEAQEKLDKVEKAEQEYVYQETSSAIKNQTASNQKNDISSSMTLRKINGIYSGAAAMIIDADFVKIEYIGGVEIFSEITAFIRYAPDSGMVASDISYSEIVEYVNNNVSLIRLLTSCANDNNSERATEREKFFQENKYSMHSAIKADEEIGRNISVIESWDRVAENGVIDAEHPTYHLEVRDKDNSVISDLLVYYNGSSYKMIAIEKICPEFWAQVEAEQAQQTPQEQALNETGKYTTRDQDGNVTEFDYAAYQQDQAAKAQQTQTSKETTSPVIYDIDLTR